MKLIRLFIMIAAVFLLANCGHQELELAFFSPEIVLNSHLIAHKSPRVYVGKMRQITESLFGEAYTAPYYDNATVELWEGAVKVGEMVFKDGNYVLDGYEIKPQKTYLIKARVPGIGSASSHPVTVPPDPILSDFQAEILTERIYKGSYLVERPMSISFILTDNAINRDDYFVVAAFGSVKLYGNQLKNGLVNVIHNEIGDIFLPERSCYDRFALLNMEIDLRESYPTGVSTAYKNTCFPEKTKRINIYVSRDVYVSVSDSSATIKNASKIGLLVANYPAEYVRWKNSTVIPRENDPYPTDAAPTYSNIIGGTGFVYATNTMLAKVFDLDSLGK